MTLSNTCKLFAFYFDDTFYYGIKHWCMINEQFITTTFMGWDQPLDTIQEPSNLCIPTF